MRVMETVLVFFLTVAIWTAAGYFIGTTRCCSREAMRNLQVNFNSCTIAAR